MNSLEERKNHFIKRAIEVHGDRYIYENVKYKNANSDVNIRCRIHGVFWCKPKHHTAGSNCPKCAVENRTKPKNRTKRVVTEDFIKAVKKKLEKRHNSYYNYPFLEEEYVNSRVKMSVECPEHGLFKQWYDNHAKGHGCPLCAVDRGAEYNRNNPVGWSYRYWEEASKKSKNFESYSVYVIKCTDGIEVFYKIGRTFRGVSNRFKYPYEFPYSYEIIKIIVFDNARECCEYEQELKNINTEFKYIPKKYFKGMYECFSKININENTYNISIIN